MINARAVALCASLCSLACASHRMLPPPAASPGVSPMPLRYEQTRLGIFTSTKDDVALQQLFANPAAPDQLLASVLRPEVGLLSSQDGGASFSFLALGGDPVRAMLFDPLDTRRSYARSGGRLFRSEDSGRSFALVELKDDAGRPARVDAAAVAGDGALYAASDVTLFASRDGGRTFQRLALPVPAPGKDPVAPSYRARSLVADPAIAGTLYVSIESRNRPAAPFFQRLVQLFDGSSSEAPLARRLAEAPEGQPQIVPSTDRLGVYVTRDGGGLWQKTGLPLDSWLVARPGELYAILADPVVEAAGLARRWPSLAAYVSQQLHGYRTDQVAVSSALAWPGREAILGGPLTAAVIYRSTDGGATFAHQGALSLAQVVALRESLEQQKAARVALAPTAPQEDRPAEKGHREGSPREGGSHHGPAPQRDQPTGAPPGGGPLQQRMGGDRGGRQRPPPEEKPPERVQRPDLIEPLLAVLDPLRLLASFNGGAPLTGLAHAGRTAQVYAYAPTEAYWDKLVAAAVVMAEGAGEISLGDSLVDAASLESGLFELLGSSDGGVTFAALPEVAAAVAKDESLKSLGVTPYPRVLAATPAQALLLLAGRQRDARVWRGVFRYLPPQPAAGK